MADTDLTTAAEVAAELGDSTLAQNARIAKLIARASGAIIRHLDRRLHYGAAIVEKLPGKNDVRLMLGTTPIASITSIVLADGTTLASDEYSLEDADAGFLYRAAGWPFTGNIRPGLLYDTRDVGTEERTHVVTYAGGWVTPGQFAANQASPRTLPEDIEEACLQTVISMYRSGGMDRNIVSESLGNSSVAFAGGGAKLIPPAAAGLLEPYRRLR